MSLSSLLTDLYRNLSSQKLRSFLTIFGIMWGTATLILLLAFGMGFRDQTVLNMRGMGDQIAIVWGGQTTKAFEGYGVGRPIRLRVADAWMLQDEIPDLEIALPEFNRTFTVSNGDRRRSTQVGGVYKEYSDLRNIYESEGGRWINDRDLSERRRVVFLGNQLAENLFGEEDPIGKYVMLNQTPFIVIGVMQPKMQTSMNNGPDANRAIIPYTTFRNIYGNQFVNSMLIRPGDPAMQEDVIQGVRMLMASKYSFHPEDEQAMPMWDFIEAEEMNRKVADGLEIFLFTVGFFTLMIAGVGVANIMFVVVKERTREIGLKIAVGARKVHIIVQFVFEALFISLLGG